MSKQEELKKRAFKALLNIAEIDDEFVQKAINDADEATNGKAVANYIYSDFAYIRLKIYLKIELSEEDELLYANAIKNISKAPFLEVDGSKKNSKIYVKNRESFL